jgi:hypothetical protein
MEMVVEEGERERGREGETEGGREGGLEERRVGRGATGRGETERQRHTDRTHTLQ